MIDRKFLSFSLESSCDFKMKSSKHLVFHMKTLKLLFVHNLLKKLSRIIKTEVIKSFWYNWVK